MSHVAADRASTAELKRIGYNNPGLVVDLGVGLWAWPLPMDFDGDGDNDLVVVCPDKPYNGTYWFENPGGKKRMPVFKAAVRISHGLQNVQLSWVDEKPRVLSPGFEYPDFLKTGLESRVKLPLATKVGHAGKIRANQWKYVDYDGDGRLDLVVGIGDWTDYGWDNAYNARGEWTNGPLHGYVYLARNSGTNARPQYVSPVKLTAGGQAIDVFGWPSPNFADFDGDGDLDLICGEFLDRFSYFENVGSRMRPRYASARRLEHKQRPIAMNLQMIVPAAIDWDKDGDIDLVVGDEDGRVALIEHTGRTRDGLPRFQPPRYFQQQAADVKFGALATPCGFDWDGDGDQDILCGNTAGDISFIENLSHAGIEHPRWAAPKLLTAGSGAIRILAGPNGSIQGPCEAKWGYTTLTVGDWDHDGRPDLVVNSIWGKVVWYRNVGTRRRPKLAVAKPVEVAWPVGHPPSPAWNWWKPTGNQLVTQWRTTPVVVDFNRDGLNDLVMLDHEGYLAFFERQNRNGRLRLLPGERIFVDLKGEPIRLNPGQAGRSGRRKLAVVDWDGDGHLDLLVNSQNANLFRQVARRDGKIVLKDMGLLDTRNVAGHTSSPTVVDWNNDGVPDLLVGSEDGRLYYVKQDRTATARETDTPVSVGLQKQLFLDDHVIDRLVGVRRVLGQAKRHPSNPIVKPEHSWEGTALESPIVFWDEDLKRFRMYYWAIGPKVIYTCYATSRDGLSWKKPVLGLHAGPDGSRKNNIVLRGKGPSARTRYVVRNPYSDDPARTYLAMYIDNTPGLTEYIAYSPDGLNWTTSHAIGDLRSVTGKPPTANPRFFLVEQGWVSGKGNRYRGIWRTESRDLETWGGGSWAIRRQPDDNPNVEFYHAASHFLGEHTYHGLHLGYYYPFHTEAEGKKLENGVRMAGTIDSSLMVSRDTVNWKLVDRKTPLLSTGKTGRWDAGMVFVSPEVVVGDELRLYYGAWRKEHSAGATNDGAIGLASLRLDGFVSLETKNDASGFVVTRPFELAGDLLQVNANAKNGQLLVEVLDRSGDPIEGFSAATCRPLQKDRLRHEIRWGGKRRLEELTGRTIRLRFQLDGQAKLFAFEITDSKSGR